MQNIDWVAMLFLAIGVVIMTLSLLGNFIKEYVEGNMFQEFTFDYELFVDGESVDKGSVVWDDRGEGLAKDNVRLSLQMNWKDSTGDWPRCELQCTNSVIKNVGE